MDRRAAEFYKYLENQRNNPVDLTSESQENQCMQLARHIFSINPDNLKDNLTRLQLDESMQIVDLYSMLLEILLYGIEILTGGHQTIFDLISDIDGFVYLLKKYMRSVGFDIEITNEYITRENINLFRDRDDYYCHITPKPPAEFFIPSDWAVSNYRLSLNRKFEFDDNSLLEDFSAFFISKNKEIFTFYFEFVTANTN